MKTTTNSGIQRYLTRISILLTMLALIVGTAGFDSVGGSLINRPCQSSPPQNLEIRTWYDLDAIRSNLAGNHSLMNNLDSTTAGYDELASRTANEGKGWQPIGFVEVIFWDDPCGGGGSREDWYGLTGTFDGQGYEIRDLFVDRLDESDVGLFRFVGEGGVIKNIGVVDVTVIGEYHVGSLVGRNRGTVNNSYSSGEVTGAQRGVGGLAGITESSGGTVSNSYSKCDVVGNAVIGGLVGINEGGAITFTYACGDLAGVEDDPNGVIGWNDDGTVSNSFWDTETTGTTESDGGTGKNTTAMQDINTFLEAGWNIIAVALNETNPAYIWNIVNNVTYPFLSWEPVS